MRNQIMRVAQAMKPLQVPNQMNLKQRTYLRTVECGPVCLSHALHHLELKRHVKERILPKVTPNTNRCEVCVSTRYRKKLKRLCDEQS